MAKTALSGAPVPSVHNWRTTDLDEINRRKARAQTEDFRVANADPRHPIFSNFRIESASGLTYSVEIRDLRQPHFACDCVDFRINGLGTCKHVEAVLRVPHPVGVPSTERDVGVAEVPGAWVAVLVHPGDYATMADTYRTLGAWVARNGEPSGERIREWYVVSPLDTDTPSEWRTEIAWPIKPPAPSSV